MLKVWRTFNGLHFFRNPLHTPKGPDGIMDYLRFAKEICFAWSKPKQNRGLPSKPVSNIPTTASSTTSNQKYRILKEILDHLECIEKKNLKKWRKITGSSTGELTGFLVTINGVSAEMSFGNFNGASLNQKLPKTLHDEPVTCFWQLVYIYIYIYIYIVFVYNIIHVITLYTRIFIYIYMCTHKYMVTPPPPRSTYLIFHGILQFKKQLIQTNKPKVQKDLWPNSLIPSTMCHRGTKSKFRPSYKTVLSSRITGGSSKWPEINQTQLQNDVIYYCSVFVFSSAT